VPIEFYTHVISLHKKICVCILRAQTPGIRRKRGDDKEMDFDEILLPEFCVLRPFPAVYWYKSITLLAIVHRLHHILLAETIRLRVATFGQNSSSLISWPSGECFKMRMTIQ